MGEPGADRQRASPPVMVGSCGPNRPETHLVKTPLFSSAVAVYSHVAVFLVSSSFLRDGLCGPTPSLAYSLGYFSYAPFSPPILLRILALASAFSSGCLSTKCGGRRILPPSLLTLLLHPPIPFTLPWSTGGDIYLKVALRPLVSAVLLINP